MILEVNVDNVGKTIINHPLCCSQQPQDKVRWKMMNPCGTIEPKLGPSDAKVGLQLLNIWGFPEMGVLPVIIHFNRLFHYKPSRMGTPIYGNPHIYHKSKWTYLRTMPTIWGTTHMESRCPSHRGSLRFFAGNPRPGRLCWMDNTTHHHDIHSIFIAWYDSCIYMVLEL